MASKFDSDSNFSLPDVIIPDNYIPHYIRSLLSEINKIKNEYCRTKTFSLYIEFNLLYYVAVTELLKILESKQEDIKTVVECPLDDWLISFIRLLCVGIGASNLNYQITEDPVYDEFSEGTDNALGILINIINEKWTNAPGVPKYRKKIPAKALHKQIL